MLFLNVRGCGDGCKGDEWKIFSERILPAKALPLLLISKIKLKNLHDLANFTN